MSNSTRRFRRGERRTRTETLSMEIPQEYTEQVDAIGRHALDHARITRELHQVLARALSTTPEDAEYLLTRYIEQTGGEGHSQGLFGFLAELINRGEQAGDAHQAGDAQQAAVEAAGDLPPPEMCLRVTYTPACYPELQAESAVVTIPIPMQEEPERWGPSLHAEGGLPQELGLSMIDMAMSLTRIVREDHLAVLRDVWERARQDPSTDWTAALQTSEVPR